MRRGLIGVVVVFVLVAGGFGIAQASIPSADGTIHGCYKTSHPAEGAVIVVDDDLGETCPNGYAPLNWNQTGPQGPIGPAGPPGPAASVGYEVVSVTVPAAPDDQGIYFTAAACPEGKYGVAGYQNGATPEDPRHPNPLGYTIDIDGRIIGARFRQIFGSPHEGSIVCVNG